MKYIHTYQMLKRAGHTAAKALEILIEAKRGQRYAIDWIKAMFSHRRSYR